MMYLNGNHGFVKNFFERTKKIIENTSNAEYEVTLLCNCLLGILVFPEQKFYDELDDSLLSDEEFKKLQKGFLGKKHNTVKKVFKRMRNAVTHCNIKFESATTYSYDEQIKFIYFYDDPDFELKTNLDDYEFQLRIDVDDLKSILFAFCENLLKKEKYTNTEKGNDINE